MHAASPPPPDDDAARQPLADALEEYHRRLSAGEPVDVDEFKERLGTEYARLEKVIQAERVLDEVMDDELPSAGTLPKPFGPFTLLRELGRGGVGVVYAGMERGLGRTVAVKVLRSLFEDDQVALTRFKREAEACARVRHDNIVAIHQHGFVNDRAYYTMDIVDGPPLSRLTAEGTLPPWPEFARRLAGVADALEALHLEGVVHRDVKPQNVLVRKDDGRLVLADFGLARTPDAKSLTNSGAMLGTPPYMAPEQILGDTRKICPATDVYGLGATLYEALAGHPPFRTHETGELFQMILSQRPEWPHVDAPGVPAALERIAMQALEKAPGDRQASAAEFARELRRFADGEEVRSAPVSTGRRALRWVRRRWLPLAATAALLVGWALYWSQRPATLVIETTVPHDAVVLVNGVERGSAPLRLRVSSGSHDLRFVRRGFQPDAVRVELGTGETSAPQVVVLDRNPKEHEEQADEATLTAYAEQKERLFEDWARRLKVAIPASAFPPEPTGTRAPRSAAGVTIIAPRGPLRVNDLGDWWVEVDAEVVQPDGHFELRRGTQVLWTSAPFRPRSLQSVGRIELTPTALAQVDVGDALTFVYVPPPPPGAGTVAPEVVESLTLVDGATSDATLGRIDRLLGGSASMRHGLRAAALRAEGLLTGALRESSRALQLQARDVRALGTLRWVLHDLGLDRTTLAALDIDLPHREGRTVTLPAFGGG